MLQRIQTLLLLVVLGQCITIACVDVGRFVAADGESLMLTGVGYLPLLVIAILASLIVLPTILLYKHRLLQIRGCIFSILLLVAWYGFYFWHGFGESAESVSFTPEWTAALPACAIILLICALRAIWRDEMLVRSLDRLR